MQHLLEYSQYKDQKIGIAQNPNKFGLVVNINAFATPERGRRASLDDFYLLSAPYIKSGVNLFENLFLLDIKKFISSGLVEESPHVFEDIKKSQTPKELDFSIRAAMVEFYSSLGRGVNLNIYWNIPTINIPTKILSQMEISDDLVPDNFKPTSIFSDIFERTKDGRLDSVCLNLYGIGLDEVKKYKAN